MLVILTNVLVACKIGERVHLMVGITFLFIHSCRSIDHQYLACEL